MKKTWLIKIGEISLKGKNQKMFIGFLRKNIKKKLSPLPSEIRGKHGRFFLFTESGSGNDEKVHSVLSTTPGIVSFSPVTVVQKNREAILSAVLKEVEENSGRQYATFKIASKRTDKSFSLTSYELSCELGAAVKEHFPGLTVDVHRPDLTVSVEIRDSALIYSRRNPGPGGLPAGTAGKGVLLLSGGIDSPVAGYCMAKRGLSLDAVYFHAYPYTSDEAEQKVITLAEKIAPYSSGMTLHVVPFTEIQLHLKKKALERDSTLLMRAAMMKTSEEIALRENGIVLVTGESLSQVASQTCESIAFTESVQNLPVFRPLLGMDKVEIIEIAKKIGTYETSILPYQDCCVLFSPKHPELHPNKAIFTEKYVQLELNPLIERAVENQKIIRIPG